MQTNITPVQVWPSTASVLMVRPISFGPPVGYYYELQNVQVVPGTPAVGVEGEEGFVPAVLESTNVTVLKSGNVSMTQAQWDAWPVDADDDEYQLDAVAANLGLTRA